MKTLPTIEQQRGRVHDRLKAIHANLTKGIVDVDNAIDSHGRLSGEGIDVVFCLLNGIQDQIQELIDAED